TNALYRVPTILATNIPPPPTSPFPYTTLFRSPPNTAMAEKNAQSGTRSHFVCCKLGFIVFSSVSVVMLVIGMVFVMPVPTETEGWEENTFELHSRSEIVCRLLLDKKKSVPHRL